MPIELRSPNTLLSVLGEAGRAYGYGKAADITAEGKQRAADRSVWNRFAAQTSKNIGDNFEDYARIKSRRVERRKDAELLDEFAINREDRLQADRKELADHRYGLLERGWDKQDQLAQEREIRLNDFKIETEMRATNAWMNQKAWEDEEKRAWFVEKNEYLMGLEDAKAETMILKKLLEEDADWADDMLKDQKRRVDREGWSWTPDQLKERKMWEDTRAAIIESVHEKTITPWEARQQYEDATRELALIEPHAPKKPTANDFRVIDEQMRGAWSMDGKFVPFPDDDKAAPPGSPQAVLMEMEEEARDKIRAGYEEGRTTVDKKTGEKKVRDLSASERGLEDAKIEAEVDKWRWQYLTNRELDKGEAKVKQVPPTEREAVITNYRRLRMWEKWRELDVEDERLHKEMNKGDKNALAWTPPEEHVVDTDERNAAVKAFKAHLQQYPELLQYAQASEERAALVDARRKASLESEAAPNDAAKAAEVDRLDNMVSDWDETFVGIRYRRYGEHLGHYLKAPL